MTGAAAKPARYLHTYIENVPSASQQIRYRNLLDDDNMRLSLVQIVREFPQKLGALLLLILYSANPTREVTGKPDDISQNNGGQTPTAIHQPATQRDSENTDH